MTPRNAKFKERLAHEQAQATGWHVRAMREHPANQNLDQRSHTVRASDIPELRSILGDFTPSELRQIQVLRPGARLQQGATYIDLRQPNRRPFTATGHEIAGNNTWLVARSELPFQYWKWLLGVKRRPA